MLGRIREISKLLKNLCLVFIISIGIIAIVASGGGGDDGSSSGSSSDSSGGSSSDTDSGSSDSSYDDSDLPTGASFVYEDDDANPTTITFGSITITGDTESATYDGNIVTINSPGTFNIIGTIANGQIKVDTQEDGDVRLVFQGANITCDFGAPIDIENAERIVVRLESGTNNYLTDTHASIVYDEDSEEIDAAFYSKEDLVICGTGSLNIDTSYKDGIKTKDGLIIASGTINVTSEDDGIIGKNYICIEDGTITVDAGGDGLKSTQDGDDEEGYIYIADGKFDIDAGADAIQVETNIVIQDGVFNLYTYRGSGTTTSNTAKGLKAL